MLQTKITVIFSRVLNKETGNTVPEDLFNAMQTTLGAASDNYLPKGENMSTIMKNWIEKPGYPVVTISVNGSKYQIDQVSLPLFY